MFKKSFLVVVALLVAASLSIAFTPASIEANSNQLLPTVEGPVADWISVDFAGGKSLLHNSANSVNAPLTMGTFQVVLVQA